MDSSKGAKTRLVDSARFINPKLWTLQGASAPDLWTKRCAKGKRRESYVNQSLRKNIYQIHPVGGRRKKNSLLRS